ncbi:MAG: hypothetical protein ACFBSE_14340 [Prochloraceae cyanobacterium]
MPTTRAIHLNLKPENIKVTTIPNLPESIADMDILISIYLVLSLPAFL